MKKINFIFSLFAIISFHAQTISGPVISKDDNQLFLMPKLESLIQFIGKSNGKVALSGHCSSLVITVLFMGNWEKIGVSASAINTDVKVQK